MIVLAILVILLSSCSAGTEKVIDIPESNSIEISLKDSEISSADQCEITIDLVYHEDLIPLIPSIEELLEPIRLEGYEEKGMNLGNYYKRVINITLENLLPGDYILSPIVIPLYDDGNIIEELQSPYISLKVNSNLIEEGLFLDDFEELSPEKNIPGFVLAIIVIFLISASASAYFFFRKKEEPPAQTGEIFRRRIGDLPQESENKVYYSALTGLLREYLDRTIFLSVQSRTTEEFIELAESSDHISEEMKSRLFSFFQRSDETAFGGIDREISQRENDTRFCLELIDSIEREIVKESGT